jgi:serine protease Do
MRTPVLLLLALVATACDFTQPAIRAASHTIEADKPVQRLTTVADVLGVAVRAGVGGLMIVGIDLDGPLTAAGVQVGDFIVAVNGGAVTSETELAALVAAAARTGSVNLDLWRQGDRKQVAIAVTPPPEREQPNVAAKSGPRLLGLQVRELPQAALSSIGLGFGLMVTKVRPPADRTRLMPGDVIVGVNQVKFRSLEEFNRLIAEHTSGPIGLLVRRADADLYIALEPGNGSSSGSSRPPEDGPMKRRPATDTPLRT